MGDGMEEALTSDDLNTLQTALQTAVDIQDYASAEKLRDRIEALGGGAGGKDWLSLGLPAWLAERAESLGFKYPTAVQAAAAETVLGGGDAILQAQTGSGKTLAFLLPCLAALTDSLEAVSTLRGAGSASMMQPLALLLVPTRELGAQLALLAHQLLGGGVRRAGPGDRAGLFTYLGPRDVRVVGVLTEADAQACRTDIADGGLLEGVQILVATPTHAAQVLEAGALHTEVLRFIAVDEVDLCLAEDAEALRKLLQPPPAPLQPNAFRQVVLTGATLPADIYERCRSERWVSAAPLSVGGVRPGALGAALPPSLRHRCLPCPQERKLITLARVLRAELEEHERAEEARRLEDGMGGVAQQQARDARHAFRSLPGGGPGAGFMPGRQRRPELFGAVGGSAWRGFDARGREAAVSGARTQGSDGPRVLVFAGDSAEANAVADRLRTALWNRHEIVVCASDGVDPLRGLERFRNGYASLLVTTAATARGLDLQRVTHVCQLAVPGSAAEYVHRAGRAGRVGAALTGPAPAITSLVDPAAGEDRALTAIAAQLGIALSPLPLEWSAEEELGAGRAAGRGAGPGAGPPPPAQPAAEQQQQQQPEEEGGPVDPALVQSLNDIFSLLDAAPPPGPGAEPPPPPAAQAPPAAAGPEEEWGGPALWERIAGSAAANNDFKNLDVEKARAAGCTKFIGEGVGGSHTEHYRVAAAGLANPTTYRASDVVLISVNGAREGRIRPVGWNGALQGVYREQIELAAKAGVTFVTDPLHMRENGYNIGECEVASALAEMAYAEQEGNGIWRPCY